MKKVLIIVFSIICIVGMTGCAKKDAKKFKNEYESLNGTTNSKGVAIRNVQIDKDNPFIYKELTDIVSMIKNEEDFIVYFGFTSCPWCRSMIENLVKAAKDTNTKKIYYVDILNERDTLKLDDVDNFYVDKKAELPYYELLNLLDNVLDEYTLTNKNGKVIHTGEKRIYAPNVVAIKNGKAVALTTGISDLQTDAYMILTEDMQNESYNKIVDLLNSLSDNTCNEKSC